MNSGFAGKAIAFCPDKERDTAKGRKRGLYRVFIRDMEMMTRIGATAVERAQSQRLRMYVDLQARDSCSHCDDDLAAVVCYSDIAKRIERLVRSGEPAVLLESLAEKIAAEILRDPRIVMVTLKLEKPDVLSGEGSVGIEIERVKGDFPEDISTVSPSNTAP